MSVEEYFMCLVKKNRFEIVSGGYIKNTKTGKIYKSRVISSRHNNKTVSISRSKLGLMVQEKCLRNPNMQARYDANQDKFVEIKSEDVKGSFLAPIYKDVDVDSIKNALLDVGVSEVEIAKEFSMSQSAINRMKNGIGFYGRKIKDDQQNLNIINKRSKFNRGELSRRAKFTNQQATDIRMVFLNWSGRNIPDFLRGYIGDEQNVRNILTNHTYTSNDDIAKQSVQKYKKLVGRYSS